MVVEVVISFQGFLNVVVISLLIAFGVVWIGQQTTTSKIVKQDKDRNLKSYLIGFVLIFTVLMYCTYNIKLNELNSTITDKDQISDINFIYSIINNEDINVEKIKSKNVKIIAPLYFATFDDYDYLNDLLLKISEDNEIKLYEYNFVIDEVKKIIENKDFYLNRDIKVKTHSDLINKIKSEKE